MGMGGEAGMCARCGRPSRGRYCGKVCRQLADREYKARRKNLGLPPAPKKDTGDLWGFMRKDDGKWKRTRRWQTRP